MYNPIKNNEDTIVTILVTDNDPQDAIDSITQNTEHKLISTTAEDLDSTIASMKSAKLSIAMIAFNFDAPSAYNIVKLCMYNKIEMINIITNEAIKRRFGGALENVYLLSDIYKRFSTFSNLSILANSVRSLVPIQRSFPEAVSLLSSLAEIPELNAEQELNKSVQNIRSVVNETTNLRHSTKLSSPAEMDIKVFRSLECKSAIDLVKSNTGSGKTTFAKKTCTRAHRDGIKTCSITTLRSVVEQYTPKKVRTVVAHSETNISAFEQADHFTCTMHSLLKDHVFEFLKSCGVFIWDECEKSAQALFEETVAVDAEFLNRTQKEIIRERLTELFSMQNTRVIAMDADASDAVSLRYLKSLGKKVNAYDLNYFKPALSQSSIADVTNQKELDLQLIAMARPHINNHSELLKNPYANITTQVDDIDMVKARLVASNLVSDEKMFIATDNKKEAIQLVKDAGYVKGSGFIDEEAALKGGILLLHADNKGMTAQSNFIANPNSELSNYKTVIVTPCLREGFNITADFCDTVTVLCYRILQPMALVQMSRRLRTATNIVFALDTTRNPSFSYSNYREDTETLSEKLEAEFATRKKVLLSDLALSLSLTLENLGFNHKSPVRYSEEELLASKKSSKANRDAGKKFRRQAIENAECLSVDKAKALSESTIKPEEMAVAIEKVEVAKKLSIATKKVDVKAVKFNETFRKNELITLAEIAHGKSAIGHKANAKPTVQQKRVADSMQILFEALDGNVVDECGNEIEIDNLATEFVITNYASVYSHIQAFKSKFNKAFEANDKFEITVSKPRAKNEDIAKKDLKALLKLMGIDNTKIGNKNNIRYKHFLHPLAASVLISHGFVSKSDLVNTHTIKKDKTNVLNAKATTRKSSTASSTVVDIDEDKLIAIGENKTISNLALAIASENHNLIRPRRIKKLNITAIRRVHETKGSDEVMSRNEVKEVLKYI